MVGYMSVVDSRKERDLNWKWLIRQLVLQYNNYFGIKCESEEGVCTYLSGVLLYMIVIRARDSSRDWAQLKFTQDEDKVGTRKKQKLLAHDCFKLENWIYKVTYIKRFHTEKKPSSSLKIMLTKIGLKLIS